MWDREIQTGKVFYSDQWKRMLGFARDEIAHTPEAWKELVHPEDREKVLEELHRHQRGETPEYLAEYRIMCKDKSYKWVLARGKVTARDPKGNALRIVGPLPTLPIAGFSKHSCAKPRRWRLSDSWQEG